MKIMMIAQIEEFSLRIRTVSRWKSGKIHLTDLGSASLNNQIRYFLSAPPAPRWSSETVDTRLSTNYRLNYKL